MRMKRFHKTGDHWTLALWPGAMAYIYPITAKLKWGFQCGKGFCAVDAFGLGPLVILWTWKH